MKNAVKLDGREKIMANEKPIDMREQLMTRRHFLWISSISAMGVVAGCTTNPVTGERQLMLMSEADEIQVDQQYAPQQFSSDKGVVQDSALNNYLNETGKRMASITHRPDMPYSFQAVNATYVNAYAFPGGTVACTRGILVSMDNEAELAALLGHEIGHVNARHTASRMTKGQLSSLLVSGLAIFVGTKYDSQYAQLTSQIGMIGAGLLLAKYSRDDERQADKLGMEYMVKSGYNPKGMIGLMDILRGMSDKKPSTIEVMFSSHPMSDERYATAVERAQSDYTAQLQDPSNYKMYRERYMDNTAKLRAIKGAIDEMQDAEAAMGQKKFDQAEVHLNNALRQAPNDYAGLVLMSQCQIFKNKNNRAQKFAEKAQHVYPNEAQAYYLAGYAKMQQKNFDGAYESFSKHHSMLAGNPNVTFLQGYCMENMGKKDVAARHYKQYLQSVNQGDQAKYGYTRLVEWGYVKPRK